MTAHYRSRVPPFGYPWINAYLRLPMASRSLSRPSSAISALASTLRSCSLDLSIKPRFRRVLRLARLPRLSLCFPSALPLPPSSNPFPFPVFPLGIPAPVPDPPPAFASARLADFECLRFPCAVFKVRCRTSQCRPVPSVPLPYLPVLPGSLCSLALPPSPMSAGLSAWWAEVDSNHRPLAYQASALTG